MKTNKSILAVFAIKSILTAFICVLLFTAVFSYIALKLDLDESYYSWLGYISLMLSAFATSFVSTCKFKNSLILMSMLANIPLLLISVINSFADKSLTQAVISLVVIVASGFASALVCAKKSKGFKV
ncbi:DUF3792 family protein [uncultured Eubacterium sp.]|uniref:DUF3792 family protein n=1 Tax=uncultured Eubacterium sp. TaxID=165185 RepID=UPI0015C0C89F|nr:hypothetical protein [uncultured Eubacterium sp.]